MSGEERLVFMGDVYLPGPCLSSVPLEFPYICNLECPITESESRVENKILLRARRSYFRETFGRNPAAVCLANNHVMDYGPGGLRDTLSELSKAGVGCFGAGALSENCNNPLFLEIGGTRLALMGYVCPTTHPVTATVSRPGIQLIQLEQIKSDVEAARAKGAGRIFVHLHWGEEEVPLPRPEDVSLGRAIIDLGVDAVIGHHAHCIQPFEKYRDGYIFYGLGNAVFPDLDAEIVREGVRSRYVKRQAKWNRESLLVEVHLDSMRVAVRRLYFSAKTGLSVGAEVQPALDFAAGNYHRRYDRTYRLSMLRYFCARFLRNPKIPRLDHVRSLVQHVIRAK